MTKEEILFLLHTHCDEELEMIYTHNSAMGAMDTYAKQEAIAFLNWVADYNNGLGATPRIVDGIIKWYFNDGTEAFESSSESLYSLYQSK